MEYEEESVHNAPTAAHNAIVSMVKKVKDNILRVMTALVVMLPSAVLKTPKGTLPGGLPKALNALFIK